MWTLRAFYLLIILNAAVIFCRRMAPYLRRASRELAGESLDASTFLVATASQVISNSRGLHFSPVGVSSTAEH
jgi:hypothetical protein